MLRIYTTDTPNQVDSLSPDVYFSSGYGSASEVAGEGSWITFINHDGSWQMPLMIRSIDNTEHIDAISPYGYSGVYASTSLPKSLQLRYWERAKQLLREMDVVSLFLRHSPLVTQFEVRRADKATQVVVNNHPTVSLPVADMDQTWINLAGRARTAIRKARKSSLTGNVRPAAAGDLDSKSNFRRLYTATMERLRAAPNYYFTDNYFSALRRALGEDLLIAEIRDESDGAVASTCLAMRHGHRIHYHLAASDPTYARLGANPALIWALAEHGSKTGARQLFLGGGRSESDSLYKFKSAFGGERLPFIATGHVLNESVYKSLSPVRSATSPVADTYFPAYRGQVT